MRASTHSARREETYDRLVRQEELILDVTERLTEALLQAGVTKAELARRLDRTPAFVSQVFAGGRNLTLRTIADIAAALSLQPTFELSSDGRFAAEQVQCNTFKIAEHPCWRPSPETISVPQAPASPAELHAA